MYKPPDKFCRLDRPILSTPNVDVEEYSKLRAHPYPQRSCKNLPYYFIESESQGPRLYTSDINKLPWEKFDIHNSEKLLGLYTCLREEYGLKRYLKDEKRVIGNDYSLNMVYDNEISGCNFRIIHIKDDIVQFTHYIRQVYNLDKDRFESVMEAGLTCAFACINFNHLMEITSSAMYLEAHIFLFVWCVFFEFFVSRMQAYVYITLSTYANGTGYTTWSFCPYLKGFGISLLLVELLTSLLYIWKPSLAVIQGWRSTDFTQFSTCGKEANGVPFQLHPLAHNNELNVSSPQLYDCYYEATNFTKNMQCIMKSSTQKSPPIFNSTLSSFFIQLLSNMSVTDMTLENLVFYLFTAMTWFFTTRLAKDGFSSLIQKTHQVTILSIMFSLLICCMVTVQIDNNILTEATSAIFSPKAFFFDIDVILMAFRHTVRQSLLYYLEIGSKLPYYWHPEGIFTWKSVAYLTLSFSTMWYSYVAVYYEKNFFQAKDISCFVHFIYIENSAIPRLLYDLSGNCFFCLLFHSLQVFIYFMTYSTKITIVWRNLSYNQKWLKKFPQAQYIFDFFCLSFIFWSLMDVQATYPETLISGLIIPITSYIMTSISVALDVAVLFYYGPSRVWGDLEFLTRRKISTGINYWYLFSTAITLTISVLGLPSMLQDFSDCPQFLKNIFFVHVFLPIIIMLIVNILAGTPLTEVRKFNYWGNRPHTEQYERLRFNSRRFPTSRLKIKQSNKHESGEKFYRDQRRRALIRLSMAVGQNY